MKSLAISFSGALASKLVPPVLQIALLAIVARAGPLEDVGAFALASALGFACGSLAEAGFMTSLAAPTAYFGVASPPMRHTLRLRVLLAVSGSLLFLAFYAAGVGSYDERLLVASPLPAVLALGYGYAGAINAADKLQLEGAITALESAVTLLVALLAPSVEGALGGLIAGRVAGLLARIRVTRHVDRNERHLLVSPFTVQQPFLLVTLVSVLHGQADIIGLGFAGASITLAIYAPLLRTAYSGLLIAEALAWSLYGAAGAKLDAAESGQRLVARWRVLGVALGLIVTLVFGVLAQPFLEALLDENLRGLTGPILVLMVAIMVRWGAFIASVDIVRRGDQHRRAGPLAVSAATLVLCMTVSVIVGADLVWIAAGRLLSEVVLLAGYIRIVRTPLQRSGADASRQA